MVAAMSHLPHLIAALLVRHVAATNSAALELCGPGFRDSTRIASGAPELWADILLSNSDAVKQQLLAFKDLLEDALDRKSTRLNSSHANISYAVFCLKKKNMCLHLHTHLH